ncbi:DNA repair protein RecO [Candidatus Daviesbacteria bacterium]|nr:DNA repair protein RecO [Candidatus Daviesbacteria bacterium]
MKAFKTEGIILKRKNFGEADRILTVFTLHKGKVSVLARGVRKITSRRAGNVELLNRVTIYLHPGKNFMILTEASAINTFQPLKEDLTLSTYAYHLIETTDKLTAENQENPLLYADLVDVLSRLSKKPRQLLIRAYETKMLTHTGFWSLENLKDISSEIKNLLKILELGSWEKIEKLEINQRQALEIERILRYYLEKVIEGPLKSRQFLKK